MSNEHVHTNKHGAARFAPLAGYTPPPGEVRMAQAIAREVRGLHVGAPVAAAQVVAALHIQERVAKAQPKPRMFSRPIVKPARAVSKPVGPSAPSKGK